MKKDATMDADQKVLQYLKEARASELALTRVLQSQIAMTPAGEFRAGLEQHLYETRRHAQLLRDRIRELEPGFHPVLLAVGLAENVVGQALALSKTPLDLVRGTGGEEKVLKNAKDATATEALEIATYTALERLARHAGDGPTVELAVSIRRDEERMMDRLLAAIPGLTDAVFAADVQGEGSFDVADTGAAQAARAAGDAAESVGGTAKDAASAARGGAKRASTTAKKTASKTRVVAEDAGEGAKAVAKDVVEETRDAAEHAVGDVKRAAKDTAKTTRAAADDAAGDAKKAAKGAAAKTRAVAEDTAEDVKDAAEDVAEATRAAADDASTDAPEGAAPSAVDPDAEKPWAGYDELSVEEVRAVLLTADPETAQSVVAYEAANRARSEVLADAGRKVPAA